jgi:hypothetical protein
MLRYLCKSSSMETKLKEHIIQIDYDANLNIIYFFYF